MTFEEIYKQVEDIPGWMGKQDCQALHDAVKGIRGTIVEIGSFMGISTIVMALSSPQSEITAIDPLLTVHESSGITDPEVVFYGFIKNIQGVDNVRFIRKKSEEVAKNWFKPIDFLHIDGDHHYDAVKMDIDNFVPHVKSGCYTFFHDYVVGEGLKEADGRQEYGIVRAINETKDTYFDEVKVVSGFGSCKKK